MDGNWVVALTPMEAFEAEGKCKAPLQKSPRG
jgi:hypothetical protein